MLPVKTRENDTINWQTDGMTTVTLLLMWAWGLTRCIYVDCYNQRKMLLLTFLSFRDILSVTICTPLRQAGMPCITTSYQLTAYVVHTNWSELDVCFWEVCCTVGHFWGKVVLIVSMVPAHKPSFIYICIVDCVSNMVHNLHTCLL